MFLLKNKFLYYFLGLGSTTFSGATFYYFLNKVEENYEEKCKRKDILD